MHVTDLRTALAQAYAAPPAAMPPSYTDPVITPRVTVVKAIHILQLRTALEAIE